MPGLKNEDEPSRNSNSFQRPLEFVRRHQSHFVPSATLSPLLTNVAVQALPRDLQEAFPIPLGGTFTFGKKGDVGRGDKKLLCLNPCRQDFLWKVGWVTQALMRYSRNLFYKDMPFKVLFFDGCSTELAFFLWGMEGERDSLGNQINARRDTHTIWMQ